MDWRFETSQCCSKTAQFRIEIMTSAYGSMGRNEEINLVDLGERLMHDGYKAIGIEYSPESDQIFPMRCHHSSEYSIDYFRPKIDLIPGYNLLNQIIQDGQSWPFSTEFTDTFQFINYFLSHSAFVIRHIENSSQNPAFLGMFYIKPNFPGRSSHICNGGFITVPEYRGLGIGTLMSQYFLKFAKRLEYHGVLFNLVYESNWISIQLWESMKFQCIGTIPNAGHLKCIGHDRNGNNQCVLLENGVCVQNARMYYYDLLQNPNDK
mmetsp:Transcript_1929/g.3435  ORF Transcript_1929/g.3435 Transcript_1929/m.3435 type:complete len:264 (-) Transcript_1929:316-1107(-)